MSYKTKVMNKLVDDGYNTKRRETESKYFWGENFNPIVVEWKPNLYFKQLSDLVTAFKHDGIPIAGGAILGCLESLPFNDIDIFPLSKASRAVAKAKLENLGYRYDVSSTGFVWEYKHATEADYRPVQIINVHLDAEDTHHLLRRFDISVACVAVTDGKLYSFDTALEDIKKRTLRVQGTIAVKTLLKRLLKYKERGFTFYDEE